MNKARIQQSGWRSAVLVATSVLVMLTGCTGSQEDPAGQGSLRAVHGIVELGTVQFFIEGASLGAVPYLNTSTYNEFDNLNYDFNFDTFNGGTGDLTRLASVNVSVDPDTDYTFFVTGTPAAPRVLIATQPEPQFDATATEVELWFANLSRIPGGIDFYVGEVDFDPATAQPLAVLTEIGFSAVTSLTAADLQVVVTASGDPANILLRSEPFGFPSGDRILVNLFDNGGDSASEYALQLAGRTTSGSVQDNSAVTQLQLFHASQSTAAVDILVNDDAVTPVITNQSFGELSAPIAIDAADDGVAVSLQATPTGDGGVILLDQEAAFADGSISFSVLTGDQGEETLAIVPVGLSRRPVFDAARLGVFNAIQDTTVVDVYLLEPEEVLADESPRFRLLSSTSADQTLIIPRTYTVYVTEQANQTILAGPLEVTLTGGDIRELILVDTADPTIADIIVIDPRSP